VGQAQQSQRLRQLAALCWALGVSYRGIAAVFAVFGVGISRMTAWQDAQEQARLLKSGRMWKPVRVLGLDGAYVCAWGEVRPVLVAVDLGEGKSIAIGYVNEYNPQAVRRFLEPLVKRLIAELPPEGGRRLFEMWKQIPGRRSGQGPPLSPLDQLRLLLIRLSEQWPPYRVYDWQADVPWTTMVRSRSLGG